MDLNYLYSQHQIALMNAGAAANPMEREGHLECASDIAQKIGSYQRSKGAAAGMSWHSGRQPRQSPTTAMITEVAAL